MERCIVKMVTREEYESEIGRLQSNIVNAQKKYTSEHTRLIISPSDRYLTTQTKYGNPMCKGGGSACWADIHRDEKLWNEKKGNLSQSISNAQQALWDYQKRIAQEEQDAQIKAIREAIAEQVRLEQEKIKQQEPPKQQTQNLRVDQTHKTETKTNLLPLAVIAGVLLL